MPTFLICQKVNLKNEEKRYKLNQISKTIIEDNHRNIALLDTCFIIFLELHKLQIGNRWHTQIKMI